MQDKIWEWWQLCTGPYGWVRPVVLYEGYEQYRLAE